MDQQAHFFFGTWERGDDLPLERARRWLNPGRLKERSASFRRVPLERILTALERTGRLLTDPSGPYRRRILDAMPDVTGYSPELVERATEALTTLLSRDFLRERLSCLGDPYTLDHWVKLPRSGSARALPLGSICHVAAGNIFLGSIDSLLLGLITKNVNVLKLSRQDMVFPFLFLEALMEAEEDGEISSHLAFTYWSRSNQAVTDLVKGGAFDAILLFGGEEAVREYKSGLAPQTELLAFGPKVSFAVVASGLTERALDEAARGFALDVCLWEQRACTSCQNLFVEGGSGAAEAFARRLFDALEALSLTLPPGRIDLDEAVEIGKERELARWRAFNGEGSLFEGKRGSHTVLVGRGADIIPSPLNRTIYVNAVDDLEDLTRGNLRGMTWYLSTAGVAAPPRRLEPLVESLASLGVLRFCLPGTMGLGFDGTAPHDGVHIPLKLVRLVNREDLPSDLLGQSRVGGGAREALLLSRLNAVVAKAMRAPFYARHLAGVKLPLRSLEAFAELPLLEKSHLVDHCPPADMAMITDPASPFYVFASGGTSGKPRYVLWTPEEFAFSGKVTGEGFRAMGLGRGDRVANLLRAGALWTGFLAFNRALEETGCQILSMTCNQSPEETLALLDEHRPNAVMAMSSALLALADAALRRGWTGSIEKVYFTGEPLPEAGREVMRRVFGCSTLASPLYGAVEIGPMGYPCEAITDPTVFHVAEDWCHTEIVDGEIVATTLTRELHPLIRFRIGDRAAWVDGPCPCGRHWPRLRLLGRTGDYVRVHFGKLYVEEVEKALEPFRGLSSDFQIGVAPLGTKAKVTFSVEVLDASLVGDGALEGAILEAIVERAKVYRDPRNRELEELSVSLVPAQSLERVARTGKIRRIVDGRLPE
ncbi:acyl-CoA reductase [Aminirod propionatiphilus]|uniref:Acyl-CoA reductase n=1 Tax=Aminirod propionatiphilus TaxID=3415223 RepID=A0ACD1DW40_9BACT|nr:acyl-CoA reductase [Synergistota bacterium]